MNISVKLHKETGEIYSRILSNIILIPLFSLISYALTVTNTFSACLTALHVGQINPGTFVAVLTSRHSLLPGSWMPLSCSISNSTSAAQSALLSFGLSKSLLRFSKFWMSEMVSGVLSSSFSIRWPSVHLICWTSNIWVRPPGRSCADTGGGKGDRSDNLNAATPWCRKSDQDALTISSVSKMYPMAVSYWFSARESFYVACRLWLPGHISKQQWTMAIRCNVHCRALSSFPSRYLCSSYWMLGHCLPISHYWLQQTALQQHFRKGSQLWFLTASSR